MLKIRFIALMAALCLLSACTRYRPRRIDDRAVSAILAGPNLDRLAVAARDIHPPLLKPLPIDLTDGLSPDEAAVLAVLANPGLQSVRDEKKIARASLLQAGLLPNPRLSLGYEVLSGGDTAGTVNGYDASLGWDLTSLLGRNARLSAATSQTAAVDLTVAWKEWQVAESARLQVIRLLWADQRLVLLRRWEEAASQNRDRIQKAVTKGQITEGLLAAAESAQQQVRSTLAGVLQQREQDRLLLNRDLGVPPARQIHIQEMPAATLSAWPRTAAASHLFSGLTERRPDLLALKKGYQSQEARVRSAVLSQFPDIGINLGQARDTGNVVTTGFGIDITFPIFDHAQGRIALERATRKKLYDAYLARLFDTRAEITGIMKKIAGDRRRIAITEQLIRARKDLVDTYRQSLEKGNADILGLYRARADLLSARLDALRLRAAVADLGVGLETATCLHFPFQ